MSTELNQLQELEVLLRKRRQYIAEQTERGETFGHEEDFDLSDDRLLSHYDQLIAIVQQVKTIGADLTQHHALFDIIMPLERQYATKLPTNGPPDC